MTESDESEAVGDEAQKTQQGDADGESRTEPAPAIVGSLSASRSFGPPPERQLTPEEAASISAHQARRGATATWAGVVVNAIIVVVALFTPLYQHRQDQLRQDREAADAQRAIVAFGKSITQDVDTVVAERRARVQAWVRYIHRDVPSDQDPSIELCLEHVSALYAKLPTSVETMSLLGREQEICKLAHEYLSRRYEMETRSNPISSIVDGLVQSRDAAQANLILRKSRELKASLSALDTNS